MFCKHCGQKLDSANLICPKCGTKVSTSGGNGFWDMAGEHNHQIPNAPVPPVSPFVQKEVVIKEVKKPAIVPIAVCAALCLVCLILMIVGQVSERKTIRELSSDYETRIGQLDQQKASSEEQVRLLESRLAELESEQTRTGESQTPVRILRSPTSETKPVGYKDSKGMWLFGFMIEGAAIEFIWEKQEDDASWITLEFDSLDIDSRFGLKIDQNLKEGTSKLIADDLTPESAGNYKCTVITDHGSVSVEVQLALETKDNPNPSSEPVDEEIQPAAEDETSMTSDISSSDEGEVPEAPFTDDSGADPEKGLD